MVVQFEYLYFEKIACRSCPVKFLSSICSWIKHSRVTLKIVGLWVYDLCVKSVRFCCTYFGNDKKCGLCKIGA